MRFFHIGDLHIGRQLNGADLTDDLRHILFTQILGSAYQQYKPDGLITAGDIYDKASPSAEGVAMFDEFLSRAAELGLPVYAISGNHDSAQRVSYGRKLFSASGVHISEPFSADTPVTVLSAGSIDIALLPFFSSETAAAAFPDDGIENMTSALKAVFRHAQIPREGRSCLLVAHLSAGSEKASPIGSLESTDYRVFEPFAYTALGHFHTPFNVGGPTVRYCGSPLCFSLKEARSPQKYIDIIDISANGEVDVISHPIQPLRGVQILEDSFDTLLSDKYSPTDDYVFIAVKGSNAESDAARRLLIKFPNCVSIKYDEHHSQASKTEEYTKLDFDELFSGFFQLAMGETIEPELLRTARALFEQTERGIKA